MSVSEKCCFFRIHVLVSDTLDTWRTLLEAVVELTCLDYQAILA
jgi:hypothetical protein